MEDKSVQNYYLATGIIYLQLNQPDTACTFFKEAQKPIYFTLYHRTKKNNHFCQEYRKTQLLIGIYAYATTLELLNNDKKKIFQLYASLYKKSIKRGDRLIALSTLHSLKHFNQAHKTNPTLKKNNTT